ncbi:MAG TPA: helix-turn-helix domain-containing protein [Streptomyces sp.]|nr:helix-turn-helix domain-containing protein [Streptomyces sp.]
MRTKTRPESLPGGLKPLLTTTQLKTYYQISRWTLEQWIEAGCPVRRTPGGHKRFDLDAVEQWLDAQQPAAQSA